MEPELTIRVFTTIYRDYADCIGRRHFVEENLGGAPEVINSVSYFLNSEDVNDFIIEAYIDQLLPNAPKEHIGEAVIQEIVGQFILQEIIYNNALSGIPRLSADYMTVLVDEALRFVYGRTYTRRSLDGENSPVTLRHKT
jgi:hypothetical protein